MQVEPVISCEHLTHYYGKRKIYEDLNFTVEPGRIVGLLGKNGTGMSRKGSVDIYPKIGIAARTRNHYLCCPIHDG